jgi:hypothetical protein
VGDEPFPEKNRNVYRKRPLLEVGGPHVPEINMMHPPVVEVALRVT